MESSDDKNWASEYLLDPLNAAEPSQETGPGAHHTTTAIQGQPTSRFSTSTTDSSLSAKPDPSVTLRSSAGLLKAKKGASTTTSSSIRSSNNPYRPRDSSSGGPTPPASTSPNTTKFPDVETSLRLTPQTTGASTQIPTSTSGRNSSIINGSAPSSSRGAGANTTTSNASSSPTLTHRRRGSSLTQRHPGDQTHRPLEMLKHNDLRAHRSPHLRKKHHVGADLIDTLDNVGGPTRAYHHGGPYDATLLARNIDPKRAPVAAVREGNAEALRATPREMIMDSLRLHRPLDGVAVVPAGMVGPGGQVMQYEEGTDMMIEGQPEGGAYKRWPGVKYLPTDLKGKGEPSYSIEKAIKSHNAHHESSTHTRRRRNVSEPQAQVQAFDASAIEMTSPTESRRPLSADGQSIASTGDSAQQPQRYSDWERSQGAKIAVGRRSSEAGNGEGKGRLRKRIGNLKIKS